MTPITYDIKSASAATGLSRSYLTRVLNSGELPGKRSSVNDKTGEPEGKWLIKPADLEAYIDSLPDG